MNGTPVMGVLGSRDRVAGRCGFGLVSVGRAVKVLLARTRHIKPQIPLRIAKAFDDDYCITNLEFT